MSELTDSLKQGLRDKVPTGSGVNAVVLKLFFNSADFTGWDSTLGFDWDTQSNKCFIVVEKYLLIRF